MNSSIPVMPPIPQMMAKPGNVAKKMVQAVQGVVEDHQNKPYFEPICDARTLSVRHYHWEPSRYAGDLLHMAALVLCMLSLLRDSGTEGVSFKAHLLFLIVFTSRFLNVLFCDQSVYLILYKVMLWSCTLKIVMIMVVRGSQWDVMDTLPVCVLVIPTVIMTMVFGSYSAEDHGLAFEILWIFSNYLEGVAMLPQYIYCYRDKQNDSFLVFGYVLTMGAYRTVFGVSWVYRILCNEADADMSSVISGVLGVMFFADWLQFKAFSASPLSRCCIQVDEDLREVQDLVVDIANGNAQLSSLESLERRPSDKGLSPMAKAIGKSAVQEVELHYMVNQSRSP
eukprot:TRINITY_DN93037_c0_g1_i1.p1 TRINITY_DN93037_c0_g1~~TRINITY_DN93037_c0_g1_i1.p1  ORF type:complete len:338 (-),score=64.27 TRINITY_DN93037_c0_g1_i1:47-1060(-)